MSNRIFWAFDAFEDGLKTNIFVGETLASLNEKLKAEIYPVFTLGTQLFDLAPAFAPDTVGHITKLAENHMKAVLNIVKVPNTLSPKVVVENSTSMSSVVKAFINFAEKNGANLIAVGSHGRKGIERAVLGSFTETLLLQSHIPVLVVGQNFDQIPKWDEILFPTDFSDDSSYAFNKALTLAKTLNAKITLFHHVTPILDPLIQSAIIPFGGVWASYGDEVERLKKDKAKILDEWMTAAKESKIEVKTHLDTSIGDSAEAILNYANNNKTALVAMATQSGKLATTLFGSIARKVVRQSRCPVWLWRRHQK